MLKALGNVMPRHLLDTRLNPSGELRESAARGARDGAARPVALRLDDERPDPPLIQIRH
jgi:hypothetical protein